MLTIFGVIAVTIMFLSYWAEERSRWFVLIFAVGSGMTSLYSGLEEVYPITVIEGLWALVALQRFVKRHQREKIKIVASFLLIFVIGTPILMKECIRTILLFGVELSILFFTATTTESHSTKVMSSLPISSLISTDTTTGISTERTTEDRTHI